MQTQVTPYVAAAISVGGVLVGVAVKAAFDWLTEASRWRREDHVRFIDHKHAAYLEYIAAVRQVRDGVAALNSTLEHNEQAEQALAAMSAAKRQRRRHTPEQVAEWGRLSEQMEMDEHARDEAVAALDGGLERRLRAATLQLEVLAPESVLTAAAAVPPAFRARDADALDSATDAVIEAVRRDLRVP